MKINSLYNQNGKLFAFEIDNIYISIKKIVSLLRNIDGISNIKARKIFSKSDDIHIKFKYLDEEYIVWEPYGDSSVYWIGPNDENQEQDISVIYKVFNEYEPNSFVKVLGDILSLRILKI